MTTLTSIIQKRANQVEAEMNFKISNHMAMMLMHLNQISDACNAVTVDALANGGAPIFQRAITGIVSSMMAELGKQHKVGDAVLIAAYTCAHNALQQEFMTRFRQMGIIRSDDSVDMDLANSIANTIKREYHNG